jgi:hypothetical protein
MPKYSVPITRKILDVYIVEAKNGSHAAFIAATNILEGGSATFSRELSRNVGSAKPLAEDTIPTGAS